MKKLLTITLFAISTIIVQAQNGNITYDNSVVHTLEIISNLPPGTLVSSLNQQMIADKQAAPNMTEIVWTYTMVNGYFDGTFVDSIGIRMKCGDMSCSTIKPSLKIDFNEFVSGKKYDGLKKLNVDNCIFDPSLMREVLNYDLIDNLSSASRRTSFVNVTLDGAFFGTYVYIEQVNKRFLKDTFGNKDGNLFKFNGGGHLRIEGNNTVADYENFVDLKTNETVNDWSDLLLLIDKVNNTPSSKFQDTISAYVNVDAVLTYLAVGAYSCYRDNLYDAGNNGYWYHNTDTKKWEIIATDFDDSFVETTAYGSYDFSPQNTELINPANYSPSYPGIFTRILDVPAFRDQYYQKCCDLIYGLGHQDSLKNKIDFYKSVLQNAGITAHQNCDYSSWSDPGNIYIAGNTYTGLKDFTEKRFLKITQELNSLNFTCQNSTGIADLDQNNQLTIYPNPASYSFFIHSNQKINSVIIYNTLGVAVKKITTDINKVNIEDLPNGTYFIAINQSGEMITKKLLKH